MDDSSRNDITPTNPPSAANPPTPDLMDELAAVAGRTDELQEGSTDTQREVLDANAAQDLINDYAVINPVPLSQKVTSRDVAPAKPKKRKTGLLIAIIVILVIILAAGLIWWFMLRGSQSGSQTPVPPAEPDASEEVSLELTDPLIQTLYGYVSHIMPDQPFLNPDQPVSESFYGSNGASVHGITDSQKLAIAMQNTSLQSCTVPPEYIIDEATLDGVDSNINTTSEACISEEALQSTMREIFGEEAALTDQTFYQLGKQAFLYIAEIGSLVNMGVSPISEPPYVQNIYSAKQHGDKIYLYEAVAMPQPAYCAEFSEDEYNSAWESGECRNRTVEGEILNLGEPLTNDNLWHYYDQVDTFKWTFTKTTEGNYVLESFSKTKTD